MLYGWKDNSMLTNFLAVCAHLPITICEIERDICEKILILSYPLHSTPPLGGFPSECRHPLWYGKTIMVSLPDGEKNCHFIIPLAFDTPVRGGSRRNVGTPFGMDKLEWCRYLMVEKFRRYVYSF